MYRKAAGRQQESSFRALTVRAAAETLSRSAGAADKNAGSGREAAVSGIRQGGRTAPIRRLYIYKGILRDEHGTFCIKHSITNRSYRSKSVSDSNRRIWWHDRLVRPVCKKWIFPTRVNPSQYTSRHRRTHCGAIQIHHAVKPIISHILGEVND